MPTTIEASLEGDGASRLNLLQDFRIFQVCEVLVNLKTIISLPVLFLLININKS